MSEAFVNLTANNLADKHVCCIKVAMIRAYCAAHQIPLDFIKVDTLQRAKELPCVFNNWGVFYKGEFETVNLLDGICPERILKH